MTFRRFLFFAFILLFAIINLVIAPKPVQAAGTVASCDEAALVTALSGGGTVTFNFGAPCTITFTSRKTLTANTTIQNTGSTVTLSGGGTVGLFYTFTNVSLNISNVTMQNTGGNGAILVQGTGLLTVNNVIFQNNNASPYGAAIRTNGGSTINMNISNSQFISNNASSIGGAVYINMGGNYSFTNNTFTNNTAGFAPPNGQAIFKNSNAANITLTNNTFTNNTCDTNFSGFIDGGGNTRDAASVGCPGTVPAVALNASAVCVNEDLQVTITAGDPNFNITGAGTGLPVNNVATGVYTLDGAGPGPNSWTGVTVTELTGNTQSTNLGNFNCTNPQTVTVQFNSASGSANEASGIGNVLRVTTSNSAVTSYPVTVTVGVTGGTANVSD